MMRHIVLSSLFVLILLVLLTAVTTVQAQSPALQTGTGQTETTTIPKNSGSYAVGWGTLALINAGLAQGKNRGGMNWFLISLLLGPIATFLLIAFYSKLPARP